MTDTTKTFLELLTTIANRAKQIEKELFKNFNQREWDSQHGNATIKDVAGMMARKEFS